ncbi:MAG TPA: hypothetical protein VFX16_14600 [Pseudonocardiaceae bacterium]|nr:hypothetical protein [Pseudonocardiaceae bacterium]
MSIPNNHSNSATPQPSTPARRNGRKCPRCQRFGTFAPHSIVCDRCQGALPLVFIVTVTVVIGGDL